MPVQVFDRRFDQERMLELPAIWGSAKAQRLQRCCLATKFDKFTIRRLRIELTRHQLPNSDITIVISDHKINYKTIHESP